MSLEDPNGKESHDIYCFILSFSHFTGLPRVAIITCPIRLTYKYFVCEPTEQVMIATTYNVSQISSRHNDGFVLRTCKAKINWFLIGPTIIQISLKNLLQWYWTTSLHPSCAPMFAVREQPSLNVLVSCNFIWK